MNRWGMRLYQYVPVILLTVLLAGCNVADEPTAAPSATPIQTGTPPTETAAASAAPTVIPTSPWPSATPIPVTPTKSLAAAQTPVSTTPERMPSTKFPEPPERDLYRLTAELKGVNVAEGDRVVNPTPVSYAAGRQDRFWLVDILDLEVYSSRFELRLVTPHAYWYFEEGLPVRQADLERMAAGFEEVVYPRVTAVFGREWTPGVDNDPHLTILNANLAGVGGYYSSSDEYPTSVREFSNQREMIYINAGAIPVSSPRYLEVLAHELQHAVHWNADASEDTWVNEGLSELAVTAAGFGQSSVYRFLRSPPTSLVHWPLSPVGSGANYGAASLFMHYLVDHYGSMEDLRPLLKEPADSIAGIDAYLEKAGYDVDFHDVFRDWAAANFLDEDRGIHGYSALEVRIGRTRLVNEFSELSSSIPQYAVEYVTLDSFQEPLEIHFRAPTENRLLPTDVAPGGCWWSNSGDSISSTLTRLVDLTGLERATLEYRVWFEIEEDWDYGYLQVSVDSGKRWDILETPHTTAENPIGASFGVGYTGDSGGWIDESVDLTGYAGQEVQLRFQYVTDDAIDGSGLCVRGVSIPELGVSMDRYGWNAEGFVLTDNNVKQDYIVQVIEAGQVNRVTQMRLDESNSGSVVIAAPAESEKLVVAVAAVAPKTRQEAEYTLVIGPVN